MRIPELCSEVKSDVSNPHSPTSASPCTWQLPRTGSPPWAVRAATIGTLLPDRSEAVSSWQSLFSIFFHSGRSQTKIYLPILLLGQLQFCVHASGLIVLAFVLPLQLFLVLGVCHLIPARRPAPSRHTCSFWLSRAVYGLWSPEKPAKRNQGELSLEESKVKGNPEKATHNMVENTQGEREVPRDKRTQVRNWAAQGKQPASAEHQH